MNRLAIGCARSVSVPVGLTAIADGPHAKRVWKSQRAERRSTGRTRAGGARFLPPADGSDFRLANDREGSPPPLHLSPNVASLSTLDLPRESRRSLILRRDGSRDEAGAGYEFELETSHVTLEGAGRIGTPLRLNATSIWFDPAPRTQVPYGQTGRVTLETSEGTFGPFETVIGIEVLHDDVHAVARLRGVPLSEGRMLVAFMLAAAEKGLAAPAPPDGGRSRRTSQTRCVSAWCWSPWRTEWRSAVFNCRGVAVHASLSSFDSSQAGAGHALLGPGQLIGDSPLRRRRDSRGRRLQLRLSDALSASDALAYGVITVRCQIAWTTARYRRYRRAAIAGIVAVRFEHPLWREIPAFDRPLLDVSFGGIAFTADPLQDALYVGLRVDLIELSRAMGIDPSPGHRPGSRGLLRWLMTCGMSVEPRTSDLAEAWPSFVMQALNQTTAPGG